jgi:hypothetical protein
MFETAKIMTNVVKSNNTALIKEITDFAQGGPILVGPVLWLEKDKRWCVYVATSSPPGSQTEFWGFPIQLTPALGVLTVTEADAEQYRQDIIGDLKQKSSRVTVFEGNNPLPFVQAVERQWPGLESARVRMDVERQIAEQGRDHAR